MPATLLLGREERLEHAVANVGRHARSGIRDRELHVLAGLELGMEVGVIRVEHDVARFDHQLATLRHGIARVHRHIDDGALELARISPGWPDVAGERRRQHDVLAERPPQHVGDADHLIVELDDLSIHVPAARKRQKLIGQLRSEHRCVLCFLEQDLLLVAGQLQVQQLEVAGDDQQQIVEVVSDAAGQLAHGFHLLSLRQAPLALSQRLLDMLAVAEIMDHAGEVPPAIGGELADGQVERKGRAVLAPATHFSANADDLLDAGSQIVGDVAVVLGLVGLRHEHLDVLADQLRCAVAEQALGRRVCALDEPAVIDGDDGRDRRFQDAPKLCGLCFRRSRLTSSLCHDPLPKPLSPLPWMSTNAYKTVHQRRR